MIIAIPLDEEKIDVCVSFGRAPYFLIYNSIDNSSNIVLNPAAESQGGAGIKAAQFVLDQKADVLITVRCGENAAEIFNAANIKIFKSDSENAIKNIEYFKNNKLIPLTHFHAGYHGKQ